MLWSIVRIEGRQKEKRGPKKRQGGGKTKRGSQVPSPRVMRTRDHKKGSVRREFRRPKKKENQKLTEVFKANERRVRNGTLK